jgi:hypothetical protein
MRVLVDRAIPFLQGVLEPYAEVEYLDGNAFTKDQNPHPVVNLNNTNYNGDGMHVIHTGGKYDSYLQIPAIPPKYTSGEYVYRG